MEDTAASGTVTTGPATFAEAFAADASSASSPAVDTAPTDSASADATSPPAEPTTDAQPPQQGEPPRERWDAILANARTKAAEETRTQLEQELGWAKQVDRAKVEAAVRLATLYQNDRAAFARELIGDNPPPDLVSEFARALASRRGQPPATAEQEPQPDLPIQLEDGRVVHLYSAEQQAKREAWMQAQWMRTMEQQIAPFKQTHEQIQAMQQQAKATAEAQSFAQTFGGDLAKLPHFSELKDEIRTRLAQTQLASDHPAEVKAAAYQIYTAVLTEKVLPTLSQKAQTQLLDNLQQKAAASSGVNPANAAASTARQYKSFNELPADMWK